jgi:hypothetical protein
MNGKLGPTDSLKASRRHAQDRGRLPDKRGTAMNSAAASFSLRTCYPGFLS